MVAISVTVAVAIGAANAFSVVVIVFAFFSLVIGIFIVFLDVVVVVVDHVQLNRKKVISQPTFIVIKFKNENSNTTSYFLRNCNRYAEQENRNILLLKKNFDPKKGEYVDINVNK